MRFSGFQLTETSRLLSRFDIVSAAFSFRRLHLLLHIVSLSICHGSCVLAGSGPVGMPSSGN